MNILNYLNSDKDYYINKVDSSKLHELDSEIISYHKNINGIIVIHKGKTIFEKYYNGYTSDSSFHIASITKTILSCLIGIVIDKKYINSVH